MSWKDDIKRRLKENKQGAKYQLQEGENTFRLLPAKEGRTVRRVHAASDLRTRLWCRLECEKALRLDHF